MEQNELVEKLSKLHPEKLRETFEKAKKQAIRYRINQIPQDEIERLQNVYKRLELGQKISFKTTVPIKFDFKISPEHEYGGLTEINIKFLTEGLSSPDVDYVNYLKDMWEIEGALTIGEDCAIINKQVSDACEEESTIWAKFRNMRINFENKYNVDVSEVLKD